MESGQDNQVHLVLGEEILLTRIIRDIVKENEYQMLAYNICKDHVHLLPVCKLETLTEIIQKIKSVSSKLFHRLNTPRLTTHWIEEISNIYGLRSFTGLPLMNGNLLRYPEFPDIFTKPLISPTPLVISKPIGKNMVYLCRMNWKF